MKQITAKDVLGRGRHQQPIFGVVSKQWFGSWSWLATAVLLVFLSGSFFFPSLGQAQSCGAAGTVEACINLGAGCQWDFAQGLCTAFAGPPVPTLFGDVGKLFGAAAGSPAGAPDLGSLIIAIVQILLVVAASVATIFLIVGGYRYVTASGNEEQTEAAKKTISGAIIGLVVIVLSFAIVRIIAAVLLGGAPGTGI